MRVGFVAVKFVDLLLSLLAPPSALPALLPPAPLPTPAPPSTTSGYTAKYLLNNSLVCAAAAIVERMDLETLAEPAKDC